MIAMVYHALFVRGLSARSTREAQLGFLYGGILCTFFYILPHALGLLGRASFGVGTEPNHVFLRLMSEGLPDLLVSFVLSGAIAGAMSTLDSALMSVASYLTIDLYQRHIKPAATQGEMVTAARIAVAGSALLGGLFAYALPMTILTARGKSRHGIRPSLHPGGLRCDSVTYSRYAPSERLVRRAQERSRCSRDFHHGLLLGAPP